MNEIRREDEFKLKIGRVGDSLGVILPDELIRQLGLREGDQLDATRHSDRSLSLVPSASRRQDILKTARDLMEEYSSTLRALAK